MPRSYSVNRKTGTVPKTGVYSVERGMTVIPAKKARAVKGVRRVKRVKKIRKVGRAGGR